MWRLKIDIELGVQQRLKWNLYNDLIKASLELEGKYPATLQGKFTTVMSLRILFVFVSHIKLK